MGGVKTVLIVEDELKITRLVRDYLEQAGFAVVEAADGQAAIAAARAERPDMILLDLGLPGMDGLDVTRRLRETSSVPIIMLTARVEETDRIVGLELGADDYITKPFSPRELVARIRAVLRRADATLGGGELVRAGEVTLDIPKRRVTVRDGEVEFDRDRVRPAPHAGSPPRTHLHPRATARQRPRGDLRVVRAIDRRPHQEHQTENRIRPPASSAGAHRLRRRLPVRRCLGAAGNPGGRSRGGVKVERPGRDSDSACSSASLPSCCSP